MTQEATAQGFFEKPVDTRSRAAMTDFLAGHFKYDSCYANKVRFRNLGLNPAQMDAAYDLLGADDNYWDEFGGIIGDFTFASHGYQTISSAGRSGGYLVLYDSHYAPTGHLSFCRTCGQMNFKRVANPITPGSAEAIITDEVSRSHSSWIDTVYLEQAAIQAIDLPDTKKVDLIQRAKSDLKNATLHNKCGACGAEGERGRTNYAKPPMRLEVSRRGTADDPDEMENWTIHELRERVRLVRAFDRACDEIREEFIDMLDNCKVIEEVVMVHKTVRRIGCITA